MAGGEVRESVVSIRAVKIKRDLRLSLALLIAGVVMFPTVLVVYLAGSLYASALTSAEGRVLFMASIDAAEVFILIGAIFAGINWAMLRSARIPGRLGIG